MMPISALRSVVQQCVAAVAMFGFSLSVATPTIRHGCERAAPHVAAEPMSHNGHGTHHMPAGQPSRGKQCQCVGHSCGTALAVPTPVAAVPSALFVHTRSEPVHRADRLPAVDQHFLPFAVGPPSSILA
jgi:hypothetical protein